MNELLRSSTFSSAAALIAGLGLLLLSAPAGATPPAGPADLAPTAPPQPALVDAVSVSEIARAARALPLGGRLRLDRVVLDPTDPSATPQTLELHRVEVFTPDAEIVVHGAGGSEHLPVPDDAFFRGQVVGDPDSLAFLAVHAGDTVRGAVRSGGQTVALEPDRAASAGPGADVPLVAKAPAPLAGKSAGGEQAGFRCESGELTPPRSAADGPGLGNLAPWAEPRGAELVAKAQAASYTAKVAIETDYELFQKFGNTTDETDYITDLIGFSSGIYDQEIATDLQISHLSLWSKSSDPWTQSNPSCALYELGRYWNDNRSGVSRTFTHMMSGKNNGGGVAWVGVLCLGSFNVNLGTSCPGLTPSIDNYGGAYGYTGDLDANFDPNNPQVVWDIVAVSHEIGHNFNSPHTHCYNGVGGSSDPVDECYNGEAVNGCYSGSRHLPCSTPGAGCGTIMSYCHLLSPGMSNISLTFGTGHPYGVQPQRVPDRMRAHVDSVANLSTCLDRIVFCNPLTVGHTGPGSDPLVSPAQSNGCSAGEFGDGQTVTLTAAPSNGYAVLAWSGTDNDSTTALSNTLTFPGQAHAVSVSYCSELALSSQTITTTVNHSIDCTIRAGNGYVVGNGGHLTLTGRRVVLESGFAVDGSGATLVLGTQ